MEGGVLMGTQALEEECREIAKDILRIAEEAHRRTLEMLESQRVPA